MLVKQISLLQECSEASYVLCLVVQSCLTLCDPMDCSLPGSSVHGDSPGKNTRVGCHSFLQGIYPTQESNPGLPHCRQIHYHLSHLHVVICIVNLQEGDLICMASENPLTMESFLYEISVTLHQCFVGYYLNNVVLVEKYATLHYRIIWLLQRRASESDTSG